MNEILSPSHLSPLYPSGQIHLNSVTTAVQVPPFLHGLTPQGSITVKICINEMNIDNN